MRSKTFYVRIFLFAHVTLFCAVNQHASGWHDETHVAIAKAAGYKKWYHAAGADIAKIKAGRIESYNHWFNNTKHIEITPEVVANQIKRYNDPNDTTGHLYGAIIASLREYRETAKRGKYAEYHLAYGAHYIGDLSQPLHNTPYDRFNRSHHAVNDGIVNSTILDSIAKIERHVYPINLSSESFENDLAREIARIANLSRRLGITLKRERRDMTEEEAFIQLGHSVSLLKAVLRQFGKISPSEQESQERQKDAMAGGFTVSFRD